MNVKQISQLYTQAELNSSQVERIQALRHAFTSVAYVLNQAATNNEHKETAERLLLQAWLSARASVETEPIAAGSAMLDRSAIVRRAQAVMSESDAAVFAAFIGMAPAPPKAAK